MFTAWFPSTEGKDVFTAKTDSGYVGCVRTNECLVMTVDFFEKPLAAANAARKLKKQINTNSSLTTVQQETKKQIKFKQKAKTPLKLTGRLYTTEQAEAMPLLRFQEVWVITHGDEFVSDCLNVEKKRLVSFTKDREKAKRFKDHEDAKRVMRTLKSVVGPGFDLLRYFIRVD